MNIACLLLQYLRLTNICGSQETCIYLLEGSAYEYTEIAIGCQDYFRNITKEIIAMPDYGILQAQTI